MPMKARNKELHFSTSQQVPQESTLHIFFFTAMEWMDGNWQGLEEDRRASPTDQARIWGEKRGEKAAMYQL